MAELLIKIGDNGKFKEGDVISAFSDEDISRTWFEMLARGTHGRPEIPFVPELYKKYFDRIIQYRHRLPGKRSKIIIGEPVCNFRDASNPKKNIFAFDRPKKEIPTPIQSEMLIDMIKYFCHSEMTDTTGSKKLVECWPWGMDELKLFLVIPMSDKEFKNRLEIKGLTAPIMKKDEMIARRKYRIDFRESKILEQLKLDRSINEIINSEIPEKLKAKYMNRLKTSRIYPYQKMIEWVEDPGLPNYPNYSLNLKRTIITENKI